MTNKKQQQQQHDLILLLITLAARGRWGGTKKVITEIGYAEYIKWKLFQSTLQRRRHIFLPDIFLRVKLGECLIFCFENQQTRLQNSEY
jgi:hypothetical protein